MAAFVYGTAVIGVLMIRSGNPAEHRIWMWRFAGTMWGSFRLFRVMFFVLDPLLRNYESVTLLICIWLSAPLGLLIAEFIRRRRDVADTLAVAAHRGSHRGHHLAGAGSIRRSSG